MASQTELNYLRSSLASKRADQANGLAPVSQSGTGLSDVDLQSQGTQTKYNAWEEARGFWDQLGESATRGFLGAVEGVVDLFANIGSGIGDLTGWYDTSEIKKFSEKDYSGDISRWLTDSYAYLNPLDVDFWVHTANGDINAENYGKIFTSLEDVARYDRSYAEAGSGATYRNNREVDNGFKEFTYGLAESAGAMVPAILMGNAAAPLGETAAKAVSLSQMGLQVAGNESTQAMREGSDVGSALAYGTAKGLTEVASEIVVGKFLNKVSKATGLSKIIGEFGNDVNGWTFAKETLTKSTAKEIGKSMIEEGAEEVFTEILDPFADFLKTSGDVGTRYEAMKKAISEKDWVKDIGTSFASGAVMGGMFQGISRYQMRKSLTSDGLKVVQDIASTTEELNKAKSDYESGKMTEAQYNETSKQIGENLKGIVKDMDALPATAKENVMRALLDGEEFAKELKSNNQFATPTSANEANVVNADGREYTVEETNLGTMYKTEAADKATILDNIIGEDVPADFAQIASVEGESVAISKSAAKNAKDSGFTNSDIANTIGDAIATGKYEIVSTGDNGALTAYVPFEDGGATIEMNEADGIKQITRIKKTKKTAEQLKKTAEQVLYENVKKDFSASQRTLKNASRKGVIDLSTARDFIESEINFAKQSLLRDVDGKQVEADKLADFNFKASDDLYRQLSATIDEGKDANSIIGVMDRFCEEYVDSVLKNVLTDELTNAEEIRTFRKDFLNSLHKANVALIQEAEPSSYTKIIKNMGDDIRYFASELREYRNRIRVNRDLKHWKDKLSSAFSSTEINAKYDSTDRAVALAHQGRTLLDPWIGMDFLSFGARRKTFYNSLNAVYNAYTDPDGIYVKGESEFGFVPAIADKMAALLDKISDGKSMTMTYDEMNDANRLRMAIYRRYNLASKLQDSAKERALTAKAETEFSDRGNVYDKTLAGKAKEALFKFGALINDPKVTIKNMTGSETIANLTQDVWSANIEKIAYKQAETQKLKDSISSLFDQGKTLSQKKALKRFTKLWNSGTSFSSAGRPLTYAEAFWWYAQLNSGNQENINEAHRGYHVEGNNGNDSFIEFDKYTNKSLEEALSGAEKKLGYDGNKYEGLLDFFKKEYNGELKNKYREFNVNTMGMDTNVLEDGDYFPKTVYTPRRGTGKGRMTDTRVFLNAKTRISKGGTRGIAYADAISYFSKYVDDLATELYVRPKTDALARTIDSRIDLSGRKTYGNNVLSADQQAVISQYIKQTLGSIKPVSASALSTAMVTYTLGNPQTWLLQMGSYYVSGIKLETMLTHATKINSYALSNNNMSTDFAKAYNKLLETNKEYVIRKVMNEAYAGNINAKEGSIIAKGGEVMTSPISVFDNFTVKKVSVASIFEARDDIARSRGYTRTNYDKVDFSDPEVMELASAIARAGYQTQISSLSTDRSPLRFGIVPFTGATGNFFNNTIPGRAMIGALRMYGGAAQGFTSYAYRVFGDAALYGKIDIAKLSGQLDEAKVKANESKIAFDNLNKEIGDMQAQIEELRKQRDSTLSKDYKDSLQHKINSRIDYIRSLKSKFDGAQQRYLTDKGTAMALANKLKYANNYRLRGGAKKSVSNLIAGSLAMGLFTAFLKNLFAWIKDEDYFEEKDASSYLTDIVLNSSVSMIPVARTIVSLFQGYDVEDPAMTLLTKGKTLVESLIKLQKGEIGYKPFLRQGIEMASIIFGINTAQFGKYIYGIVERFNPEACYRFKNVFYDVDPSGSEIVQYASKGDEGTARALIGISTSSSVGDVSDTFTNELVYLASQGYVALPSALPTSYTDEQGNKKQISWSAQQTAKREYSKANAQATKMVQSQWYKKLSAEERASAIKALYQAYRYSAFAVAGESPYKSEGGKLASVVNSGVRNIGSIYSVACYLSSIEPRPNQTRKQAIMEAIRRTTLNPKERLIALYLAGVSVDSTDLRRALIACGASQSKAVKIVG